MNLKMNKIIFILTILILIVPNALAFKIDGDEHISSGQCIGRTTGAPGAGACENIEGTAHTQGCGYTCSVKTLEYEASTDANKLYSITVKVADYLENCIHALKISVYIDDNKIGDWTGIGADSWAYPSFTFTAVNPTTNIKIREDNDACCGCRGSCTPGCYGDLNMYIDDLDINEIVAGKRSAPGFKPNLITLVVILSSLILLSCYDILRKKH